MELRLFKIVKTGELCKKCEIGTRLLLAAIGFCLVLSNAAEPYFQGFCGIDVFIWEVDVIKRRKEKHNPDGTGVFCKHFFLKNAD